MGVRAVVIVLAVGGGLASSCASTARDTLVGIYNNETDAVSYDNACLVEARTFESATNAYADQFGRPPMSESDLVPDYVIGSPDDWTFDSDASVSFVPTSDGRCAGLDVDDIDAPSVGQNAVDRLDDARDTTCDTNRRLIETALETHFVINGEDASQLSDLTEIDVADLIGRWMLEPSGEPTEPPRVVPVIGGPCDR